MPIERSDYMERNVFRDYLGAKVISDGKMLDNYSQLYYQANENLVDIYLDLDFEDKDVLSVVSSSDQIYTPKLLGARRVDAFDKNRLTKYYYYLRRWAIIYNNDLYPYGIIDGNRSYLVKLLNKVVVWSDEELDAYHFWHMIYVKDIDLNTLFFEDRVNDGKTLFDNKVDFVQDVCLDDLRFNNYNFFENIRSKRKYDYVMMSNIIEYCNGDVDKLKAVRNNLHKLLKEDGKVICSRLIYKHVDINELEVKVFSELFDLTDYGNKEGYTYTKKC